MNSLRWLSLLVVLFLAVWAANSAVPLRRPYSGFMAMRGKRSTSGLQLPPSPSLVHLPSAVRRAQEAGRRADRAPAGFAGLRGKKAPSGFAGLRGKKAPSGFSGLRGKKAPSGFSGLRGKKAPSGFSGLRGKKSSMFHDMSDYDPYSYYQHGYFTKRFTPWFAKLKGKKISSLDQGDDDESSSIYTKSALDAAGRGDIGVIGELLAAAGEEKTPIPNRFFFQTGGDKSPTSDY